MTTHPRPASLIRCVARTATMNSLALNARMLHFRLFLCCLSSVMLPGCVLPFAAIDHHKPDPRRAEAVKVTAISPKGISLADGRTIALTGVQLTFPQGVDAALAVDLHADRAERLVGKYVLADTQPDGTFRLTVVSADSREWYEGELCLFPGELAGKYHILDAPAAGIFPIISDEYPERQDVAKTLLVAGLAVATPNADRTYRDAEAIAQKNRIGIWMGTDERLLEGNRSKAC